MTEDEERSRGPDCERGQKRNAQSNDSDVDSEKKENINSWSGNCNLLSSLQKLCN